jgi:hypothetical protein
MRVASACADWEVQLRGMIVVTWSAHVHAFTAIEVDSDLHDRPMVAGQEEGLIKLSDSQTRDCQKTALARMELPLVRNTPRQLHP